jgi:hypothetical protein
MADYDQQFVADYIAIQQLSNVYRQVSDEYDGEAYAKLWTEDGEMVLETGEDQDSLHYVGSEQLAAQCNSHKGAGFHVTTNPIVEIDGDRATQISRLLMLQPGPDGPKIITTATYTDELVRTPDGWRFKIRRVKPDMAVGSPVQ